MKGDQVVSTDFWEARLPDSWVRAEAEPSEVVYFEAPDRSAGIYVSTWRFKDQSLQSALEHARELELKHLPVPTSGVWQVVSSTEIGAAAEIDARAEYLNRVDQYRIVSRMLGRDDQYVRITYHDYGCTDLALSAERSEPIVASFVLRQWSATP